MYSPIEAMTSWATAVISSSLPAKWYEISRVLDNPARSPIRANDTWPKPTSAITSMVDVTICDRRAFAVTDRAGRSLVLTDMSKSYHAQVNSLLVQPRGCEYGS